MKRIFILLFPIIFFSCENKTAVVTSTSPDSNAVITFNANKSNALDPWLVTINVKGYSYDETVTSEMYNSEVNDTTIIVDWANNNEATIILKQSDDIDKVFQLFISKDHITLQ